MDYKKYIIEIEELSIEFNLNPYQKLILQIAASFESNELSYDKLKEEFTNAPKTS